MSLAALIEKQDTFTLVRDRIAEILKLESINQMNLAREANLDPTDWDLRVYTEQSNPFEDWMNIDPNVTQPDLRPRVNVWFDNDNILQNASDVVEQQQYEAYFNIDCYGAAVSADDHFGGGHIAGDRAAALASQRAMMLCRNIIMAAENIRLGMTGLVGSRLPHQRETFQLQFDGEMAIKVAGSRIQLIVRLVEFAPQVAYDTLDFISVDVLRAETGEILVEADFDYS